MEEIDFKKWLSNESISKKVISDTTSRLKRIEKSFGNIDLDDEYKKNQCSELLSFFSKRGNNEKMKQKMNEIEDLDLPVGHIQMNILKYSLNKYIKFKKLYDQSNK